jgi:Ca2+-binding RTX toxin-like protein
VTTVTVAGGDGTHAVIDYDSAAYAALASSLLNGSVATVVDASGNYMMGPGGPLDTAIGPQGAGETITVTAVDDNPATGQVMLVGDGTNLTLNAPVGSGTIIAGSGNDMFDLTGPDSGVWNVYTGPSGSVVDAGNGGGFVVMDGADTVNAGAGPETVFGAAASGGQITGGSGTLLYAGGTGPSTITAGSGLTIGFGSTGATTYTLGTGPAVLVGGPGAMTVNGGTGQTQVFGTSGSTVTFAGPSDNNVLVAGDCNETLDGSGTTGADVFFAGAGNDQITGGSGNDTLFGGTGSATLTGGQGATIFAFVDQADGVARQDTIVDFSSADRLELIDGLTVAGQQVSSGNLVVMLSDNTQLTFAGITTDLGSGSIIHF